MIDNAMKEQLQGVFANLEANYTLQLEVSPEHTSRTEAIELLEGVAQCSENITFEQKDGEGLKLSLLKDSQPTGVSFRAVPTGHEFTSLLLAILNADGKGRNLPDSFITGRIKALNGDINLTTYMSLTCTNCPDIVQALNVMAILNPRITHQAVDGAINVEEVESLNIQSVPTVYADGVMLSVGRAAMGELLDKLEAQYGVQQTDQATIQTKHYDVVVAGGGPAGATAAIYSARKGLSVAVVAGKIGGQVNETVAIENLISTPQTTGSKLAGDLRAHMEEYDIDILDNRQIETVEQHSDFRQINIRGGETLTTPALIMATGASWRKLSVEGEAEYMGRGVAFCPHCDGPFYKDKHVAVIGGGNSGVEAAIDLAGICSKVTVLEFMEDLKADGVLQEKLYSLPNVDVIANVETRRIQGDGAKVNSIVVRDRSTQVEQEIELSGIFIQIGLLANSSIVKDLVETNRMGEIVVDRNGRSTTKGIYGAGDVTDVHYKQIIIAMGEGAKASLAAFDDRMRGEI